MNTFKLNESDILSNQDWTFPTNIAYGPGRLKEIGKICNDLDIKNPLIVTDKGSQNCHLSRIIQSYLTSSNIKSDYFLIYHPIQEKMKYQLAAKNIKMEITMQLLQLVVVAQWTVVK